MNKNTERLHYMDAMRSILMILGIVLHSANVFSEKEWAIQNIETSSIFFNLSEFIHLFRMPAFFIVSGFFCHMTLKKNNALQFSKVRIPRILVPLIVTALTLNILQNYLLLSYTEETLNFHSENYWLHGKWDSHLWFLNSLLYYFSLSALAYALIPKLLATIKNITNRVVNYSQGSYLLLIPLLSLVLIKISYSIPTVDNSGYDFSISESIKFSGFFIFGILLGTNRDLLRNFVKPNLKIILLSVIIVIIVSYYLNNLGQASKFAKAYTDQLTIWLACTACFYIFFKFFNSNSKFFQDLASASYTIYLFHHILVIAFGLIIIQLNLGIWFKFVLLVSLVFIATHFIHRYFISKSVMLSRLFNGKHPNA